MHSVPSEAVQQLMRQARVASGLPDEQTPLGQLSRQFFVANWETSRANLFSKTSILRVRPEAGPVPMTFRFEIDRPFKRKPLSDGPVQLDPGPICGAIYYRPNLFIEPDRAHVAVQIDPRLNYLHPNCSRRQASMVCLGELPQTPFPLPLDMLFENYIYPILTYQNMTPSDALDREAALYFAFDPDAKEGLEPVPPLY